MTTTDTPIRRVDVNASDPGAAVVRLSTDDSVGYTIGTDESGPGGIGFAAFGSDCAVQVIFEGSESLAADRMAELALAMIDWLRVKRPYHDCHLAIEAELGVPVPETDED